MTYRSKVKVYMLKRCFFKHSLFVLFLLAFFSGQVFSQTLQVQGELPVLGTLSNDSDLAPVGKYWFDGKRWQLRIRIGVWGLDTFRSMTKESAEVMASWQKKMGPQHSHSVDWSQISPLSDDRQKRIKSISDFPYLRDLVLKQLAGVEKNMTSDFLDTKIEVIFLDESKSIRSDSFVKKAFRQRVGRGNPEFLPVLYSANLEANVIRPGIFDAWAASPYIAHEIFHRISLNQFNDGYEFLSYPLRGIMNGGNEFQRVFDLGLEPQIVLEEWNTFLLAQHRARVDGNIQLLAKDFRPNYFTESPFFGDSEHPWILFEGPNRHDSKEMDRKVKIYLETQSKSCEVLFNKVRGP